MLLPCPRAVVVPACGCHDSELYVVTLPDSMAIRLFCHDQIAIEMALSRMYDCSTAEHTRKDPALG